MSKLQSEHDAEREKILSQHEQEMNNLLGQGADLTPAQLEERKLQLVNSQQQQLKLVDLKCACVHTQTVVILELGRGHVGWG